MEHAVDPHALAWAAGWLVAVGVLFVLGLALPLAVGGRPWRRRVHGLVVSLAGCVVAALAVIALSRHDSHLDLTRERAYTPSPQALAVAAALDRAVDVTYYYQGTDPNARRALEMLALMASRNPLLTVRGVDPDKQPSLAHTAGVKIYNAALIESGGRRVIVNSTDESEIAIGIQRALRTRQVRLCFVEGHHEYSISNAEFANEVERAGQHEHASDSALVIETTPHGIGRWRRSLEGLGYDAEAVALAALGEVPDHCAALIVAGPRTPWTMAEGEALRRYLARGGAALLLLDIGFEPGPALTALLDDIGVVPVSAVVTDGVSHYGTDSETIAVTAYEPHPVTADVAYTFYPGARPLRLAARVDGAAQDITTLAIVRSSRHAQATAVAGSTAAVDAVAGAQVLAAASEGRLAGGSGDFRALVVGDADFASNAHYPHLANAALALGMVRWLVREEGLIATAPRVPVVPLVLLTEQQLQRLYVVVVAGLPLLALLTGIAVWWKRR